jgi:transketolase
LPADYQFEEGRGVRLTAGDDAVLFAYGPVMLGEALSAARLLRRQHGIGLAVINLPWLNRIDVGWFAAAVSRLPAIFTLDNHLVHGGQGDMLLRTLAEVAPGVTTAVRLGVAGLPACGQDDEVLRAHGLDADSLCRTIAATLQRRRPHGGNVETPGGVGPDIKRRPSTVRATPRRAKL